MLRAYKIYLINNFLKLCVYVIHIIYVVKTFKTLMKFSMPKTNEKTLNNEIFVCYKSAEKFFLYSRCEHIMCMLNVFFYVYYSSKHMYIQKWVNKQGWSLEEGRLTQFLIEFSVRCNLLRIILWCKNTLSDDYNYELLCFQWLHQLLYTYACPQGVDGYCTKLVTL